MIHQSVKPDSVLTIETVGPTQFTYNVREMNTIDGSRLIQLLARHPGETQYLDHEGYWQPIKYDGLAREGETGLVLTREMLMDHVKVDRAFRDWLARINQTTPVGRAIWKWAREAMRWLR